MSRRQKPPGPTHPDYYRPLFDTETVGREELLAWFVYFQAQTGLRRVICALLLQILKLRGFAMPTEPELTTLRYVDAATYLKARGLIT